MARTGYLSIAFFQDLNKKCPPQVSSKEAVFDVAKTRVIAPATV
jgi:hypothetical protein